MARPFNASFQNASSLSDTSPAAKTDRRNAVSSSSGSSPAALAIFRRSAASCG